jgi:hypothetical protein
MFLYLFENEERQKQGAQALNEPVERLNPSAL